MNRIFYIPGLGDHYDQLRRAALRHWRARGLTTELIPMRWYDGESYDDKYRRAHGIIQAALDNGDDVSLVGESAGGSMAISLFVQLPRVRRLITIAGVNNATAPIASSILHRAPAFGQSMRVAGQQLTDIGSKRRSSIHTINGLYDHAVSMASSTISGAHMHRSLTVGHLMTIAACLTIQKHRVISYATSRG